MAKLKSHQRCRSWTRASRRCTNPARWAVTINKRGEVLVCGIHMGALYRRWEFAGAKAAALIVKKQVGRRGEHAHA